MSDYETFLDSFDERMEADWPDRYEWPGGDLNMSGRRVYSGLGMSGLMHSQMYRPKRRATSTPIIRECEYCRGNSIDKDNRCNGCGASRLIF